MLDRDGTIIVDSGYVGSVERVEFIDGRPEAIARFNQAGIPVAVLTNQAGVAHGFYGINDVLRVHDYISEKLARVRAHVDLFLYCPFHPDGVVAALPAPVKTANRGRAWPRQLPRRSTWTWRPHGLLATVPKISAWPKRSALQPSTWGLPAFPAQAFCRSQSRRRSILDPRKGSSLTATYDLRDSVLPQTLNKFPATSYDLASFYCGAYFDAFAQAATPSTSKRWSGRLPSCLTLIPAGPASFLAATAARLPSPTTFNATT